MFLTRSLALAGITFAAAAAFGAPSPVGTWTGKLTIPEPKNVPADKKAGVENFRKMMSKIVIKLTLKGDHTFSTSVLGGPQKGAAQTGNWKAAGSTVTLSSPARPGEQKFTLSADGKTMKLHSDRMDAVFVR